MAQTRGFARLGTEARAAALADLHLRSTEAIVRVVVDGHAEVVAAVQAAAPAVAALADVAVERLDRGGRLVYAGAGAAGRLAAVDASEWGPTFSAEAFALVAGAAHPPGSRAEAAAEDDAQAGARELATLAPGRDDVVVAVSASGRTPYAIGVLEAARDAGALTGAIVGNHDAPLAARADHVVVTEVGPEAIAGSTRLKAGGAQKLILNAFSTAVAVRRGRSYAGLMTSMRVANDKLRDRAARVVMAATGADEATARAALQAAADELPVAILALAQGATPEAARARLAATGGDLCAALG